MKTSIIEVLSKDELELIHSETLKLLENVGICVESKEARDLLEKHGANIVSNKTNFVTFPEELVKESIKRVPKEFILHGTPKENYSIKINMNSQHFGTFGAAIKTHNPNRSSRVRKTLLSDLSDHIRLANMLKNISCSHLDVWPNDVPFTELHYHALREWGRYGIKPFGMSCYGRTPSLDMMKITSIIIGSEDELIKKPRLIGVFNPTSPLILPHILLNGLFVFAKYHQPLLISAAASAGSTAPVTLAGVLTQANMEVLSTIVLTQIINPGMPVLYGSTNAIMDVITGNIALGSIEMSLLTIASAQIAHFYQIPSKGSGCLTESKCFDLQNGFERFMVLSYAINAGHNYITCAGTYESAISETLELLVIDDELIGLLKRGIEGIRVNEETIAAKEIQKIGTTTRNYLGTKHSVKNTRKEIYVPRILNREKRGKWIRNGAKDLFQIATEKVQELLNESFESNLSKDIENELEKYHKKISSRTLEDYKKLEGISESSSSINIGGIDLDQ
ncbi:MAG: trimethylamine methyltransferase family protein [Promethearchaeota archaeon]